jgi:hypothetical protein
MCLTPARGSLLVALVFFASGCQTETTEVLRNPFFGNLPGAQHNMAVKRDLGDYRDPTAIPEEALVVEVEPGKTVLVAKSVRHLMVHIHNTLEDDDRELFVSQVLSEKTRGEFRERGHDPGLAFDFLKAQRSEIDALFNAMPAGETTPGLFLRPVGDNTVRLVLDGMAGRHLSWIGIDARLEGGNYKLRWFVDRAAHAEGRAR